MKKLYRSKSNKQFFGLCGGLAEYFGIDASILRILVVIIALCTALVGAFIIYLIVAMIVPEEPDYYDV